MKMQVPARGKPTQDQLRNNVDVANSLIETGRKLFIFGRDQWHRHFSYSITISEKDSLYGEVLDWLTSISPDEKHRALTVSSSRYSHGDTVSSDDDTRKRVPLLVRFNEGTQKTVEIEGYKVTVSVVVPESSDKDPMGKYEQSKVVFVMQSHRAQKAVLRALEEINDRRGKARKPVLRMVGTWNNWITRSDLPPRTMESVSLPVEQKDRIREDLARFLDAEEQYNRLAIPWHRGFMFYGPPGTGKTSLVKALAHEFNLDLWYVSLSDLKAEASLIGLLAEVGPRSLLLLEDIDTIKITHDRDNAQQGQISMSSLLNTLDGVATPHGLIAVMTTNRFDVLDEALTRAGRMDLIEHLDYPSINTLAQMYKHFYGKLPSWRYNSRDEPLVGLATSQVAEVMKRYMDDPKTASKAIQALIENL